MRIEAIEQNRVIDLLKGRNYLFGAAISFEERCTHICALLAQNGVYPSRSELLDYPTVARPAEVDKALRLQNKTRFSECLQNASHVVGVNPYSDSSLREHCSRIAAAKERIALIDITCMTRAHLVSLASVLAEQAKSEQEVYFSYTAAESYSIEKEVVGGWREVLLLPVGNPSSLRREGHARGIVFIGHDAERLGLALNELEPDAGCIILSRTPRRPDLGRHAQQANKTITEYLLSLRMPRMKDVSYDENSSRWKRVSLDLDDYSGLETLIAAETMYAAKDEGPVILFPFGPKNLALAAASILASAPQINAWAVYPIPFLYDVDYSQKTARVHWMRLVRPSV